jgi:glycosyltransferase involved in cell wall biosynthesis
LADNIFYHQVAVSQGYSRTFFLEAIRNVVRKIKEINPDLVHGQGTEGYPALAAAFSGYPNCITIHGNMREVAKRQRFSPLFYMVLVSIWELLALKKTDAVFCNSSYTDACVGGLNKNKPRIFNAVRSSFFDLRSKKTEESAPPILLCIGHILPYKNQIALIRALDELPNIGKIKLLFAGSCCPEDEYGRKFLKEVSTRSWCEYAGRLEQKELMDLLSGCDGVIHPTLEDSFGLAVAEAQAAGVPVAASAIGGIPDLIEHEKTGLLFNPHDPEDIRQKVIQLLDQTVTERLSRNARVFAEAEYRPEIIARKQLQLYRDVLGS